MGDKVIKGKFIRIEVIVFMVLIFMLNSVYSGYVDYPTVKVVDQNYRLVKGVEVTVTYQRSWRPGDYVTSLPVLTDDHGTAHLRVVNTVPDEDNPDYTYTITIRYLNYTDSQKVTYSPKKYASVYFVIPLHKLMAYIYSPGKGGVNATTSIMGIEKNTTKGYVWYTLPPGEYVMYITYMNETFQLPVTMGEQDTYVNFTINEYEPTIEFVDDKGVHLNGTLTVCGKSFDIVSPQKIKVVCTPIQNATAEVYAKRLTQSVDLSKSVIRFVFDITGPVVREALFYADKQSWGVKLDAYDPGVYASGLKDYADIEFSILRPGETTPIRRSAKLYYNSSIHRYVGIFQHEDPGTRIDAVITVSDNAGNEETYSTTFVVGEDARITEHEGTVAKNETQQNEEKEKNEGGIDWTLVIGFIVLVIIIAGIVYYLKNKYS